MCCIHRTIDQLHRRFNSIVSMWLQRPTEVTNKRNEKNCTRSARALDYIWFYFLFHLLRVPTANPCFIPKRFTYNSRFFFHSVFPRSFVVASAFGSRCSQPHNKRTIKKHSRTESRHQRPLFFLFCIFCVRFCIWAGQWVSECIRAAK